MTTWLLRQIAAAATKQIYCVHILKYQQKFVYEIHTAWQLDYIHIDKNK